VSGDPTRGRGFDELARDIATGAINRREALKYVFASGLAAVLPASLARDAEAKDKDHKDKHHRRKKVTICHRTRSKKKKWVKIRVSKKALRAHLKHGDFKVNKKHPCPPSKKHPKSPPKSPKSPPKSPKSPPPTATTTTTRPGTTSTTTTAAGTTSTTTTAAGTTSTTTTAAGTTSTTTTGGVMM
jgi:hypothetical protein